MAPGAIDNGWHPGLGFPLKPMVLLDGCPPSKPEYYRANVLQVHHKKDAVQLQWVHVPGRAVFWLPCSSDRIWRCSYKFDHWQKLPKEGAWRPLASALNYIYTPVAVRPAPPAPTAAAEAVCSLNSGKKRKRKAAAAHAKQQVHAQQQQQQAYNSAGNSRKRRRSSCKDHQQQPEQEQQQRRPDSNASNSRSSSGSPPGRLRGMARVEAMLAKAAGRCSHAYGSPAAATAGVGAAAAAGGGVGAVSSSGRPQRQSAGARGMVRVEAILAGAARVSPRQQTAAAAATSTSAAVGAPVNSSSTCTAQGHAAATDSVLYLEPRSLTAAADHPTVVGVAVGLCAGSSATGAAAVSTVEGAHGFGNNSADRQQQQEHLPFPKGQCAAFDAVAAACVAKENRLSCVAEGDAGDSKASSLLAGLLGLS